MATIKIRGRLEPLVIDDERARKIKDRKFGVEGRVARAEPNELIDLGEWAGEYGRIVEIEFSNKKEKEDVFALMRKKQAEEREHWLAQSAKTKAQNVGWFKLLYASRVGDWHAQPSQELLERVIAFQEAWYEKHPRSLPMSIDKHTYGTLLPSGEEHTLAEKMRV